MATGLLALVLVIACRVAVQACTVFFAFDGQLAIAGLNEDWCDANTQYSLVFDLTRGAVIVYRDRRFDDAAELNVQAELAKGPHAGQIRGLFSNGTR